MKKIVLFVLLSFVFSFPVFAKEAEEIAKEIHHKAMSDVIYTEQELKALYLQNTVIIDLLRDIKGLLRDNLENQKEAE